ncbi:CASP-like protein 1E1 [Punica granatum]|uniref:CASP-like protein n=2 Tax=Punica granatum TaxID=22663 RepID=A0A218WFK7_PUNGR|nr:CASP-like protein 1E1 [Punica granatum]OWM71279.1 hypothetical protein CDL15_Pgr011406 [Punica granatum]PKI38882.1 hypothetical protein CRG98_040732 [Punica granatum]
MNGTPSRGGEEGAQKVAGDYEKRGVRGWELALRAVAFGLTLAAVVVLGTDKQTTTVPLQVSPSLPPLIVPVSAKWHYLSAFVYFVVANAVACGYAALSLLLLFLISRGGKTAAFAVITIIDIMMVALLFSSNGATTAVGILGREGNSHVQWNKVCNVFDKFCDRVAVAVVLSLVGSLGFVILASFAIMGLHRRSN